MMYGRATTPMAAAPRSATISADVLRTVISHLRRYELRRSCQVGPGIVLKIRGLACSHWATRDRTSVAIAARGRGTRYVLHSARDRAGEDRDSFARDRWHVVWVLLRSWGRSELKSQHQGVRHETFCYRIARQPRCRHLTRPRSGTGQAGHRRSAEEPAGRLDHGMSHSGLCTD